MPFVECPRCHGGCSLCGGSGRVRKIVADVYLREESRATTKITRKEVFPDEIPTAPDILKRARRRERIVRIVAFGVLGTVLGIALGLAASFLFG